MLNKYVIMYQITSPGHPFSHKIVSEYVRGYDIKNALQRFEQQHSLEYEIFSIAIHSTFLERDDEAANRKGD